MNRIERLSGLSPAEYATLLVSVPDNYDTFPISKGNGRKRWISAPSDVLKHVQHQILKLLYRVSPHESVHGFVPGRSIVSNALPHVGQQKVLNMDIKDFFPSTRTEALSRVLEKFYPGFTEQERVEIITLCSKDGGLPQGAPTSPHLANLALWDFDVWAHQQPLNYTRYADDLTFSGSAIPEGFTDRVRSCLGGLGYRIAPNKTSFRGRHRRQMVTGLVVNEKVQLPRPLRRRFRAILHQAKTAGLAAALERSNLTFPQLMGTIGLQAQYDPTLATKQTTILLSAKEKHNE